MPSARLLDLQHQFNSKQDELVRLVSERQEDGSPAISHAEAQQREAELDRLHGDIKEIEDFDRISEQHGRQARERRQIVGGHTHAGDGGQGSGAPTSLSHESLGQLVGKALSERGMPQRKQFEQEFACDMNGWLGIESKATMTVATGWIPNTQYDPRVVEKISPSINVLQLFPTLPVDSLTVQFQEETTSTNAAIEIGENVLYPEAAIAMTPRTATIRKVGTHLPVTDELLADVAQAAQFIDFRMRYFVRRRLDFQLLRGDGIAPNILGIINTPSVLTQPMGGDSALDAIYQAIVQCQVTGEAEPTAVILHPNDFTQIRLSKTSLGYIWGPPSQTGPVTIWGLPLVQSVAMPEGTGLVGDFSMCQLYLRQEAIVELGLIGDDFKYGRQAVRASLRAALSVFRPQAFALVTGI